MPPEDRFERLARLGRRAPQETSDPSLPPALATRVLAELRAAAHEPESPLEWLSFRAVPLAAVAAAICIYFAGGLGLRRGTDEQRLAQAIVQEQLSP
jgi:hypothetical protein